MRMYVSRVIIIDRVRDVCVRWNGFGAVSILFWCWVSMLLLRCNCKLISLCCFILVVYNECGLNFCMKSNKSRRSSVWSCIRKKFIERLWRNWWWWWKRWVFVCEKIYFILILWRCFVIVVMCIKGRIRSGRIIWMKRNRAGILSKFKRR